MASKNSPDVKNPTGEHGAESKDEEKGKHFLGHFNIIALGLFIAIVVASQFWFQGILQFFRDVFGVENLNWWQIFIVAIAFTVLIYFLAVKVFRVPVASLF